MEKESVSQRLTRIAAVAAIYFTATLALYQPSFGPIQIRISEMLVLLCFFRKDYCYALILGCFMANLFSPFGWYDVIFGTAHTALSVLCIAMCKNMFAATLFPVLFSPIVSLEIHLLSDAPLLLTVGTVAAGEAIAVIGVGYTVFYFLRKNKLFLKTIGAVTMMRKT